jgi:hypothetical protein
MTVANPEMKEKETSSRVELRLIDPSDTEAFQDWLELRKQFVDAQGWLEGAESDFDRYDADPRTLHIVTMREGKIVSGLRLTPFDRPQDSLSWSMLTPEMKQEATMKLPIDEKIGGWDLTRLVVGEGIGEMRELVQSFMEMLGAGYALTRKAEDDLDPRWFFVTYQPFFMFFARQGIEFTALAKGQISESDAYECVFSYANPAERTEWLGNATGARFNANFESVIRGIKSVESGEIVG